MQRRMALAGLFTLAVVLGGCSEAPSRGELVRALEVSGIPTDRAECAADAVLDELSEDEIIELVERGPGGAPRDDPDATDDSSDRVRAALVECQQVGVSETTVASSTTETQSAPPTTPATDTPASGPGADPENTDTTAPTSSTTSSG